MKENAADRLRKRRSRKEKKKEDQSKFDDDNNDRDDSNEDYENLKDLGREKFIKNEEEYLVKQIDLIRPYQFHSLSPLLLNHTYSNTCR
jgi:hypothetical protein